MTAIQSVHEPALRMAINGIDNVIDYHLDHLPRQGTEADNGLHHAILSLRDAKCYLKEWASFNDITIQKGMKT